MRNSLINKFKTTYPTMSLNSLHIAPIGSKPRGYEHYKMKTIYISKASLKKSSGTFSVLYTDGIKERKRFFKYLVDAKIAVYKASQYLKKGTPLDESDLSYEEILFDNIRFTPITKKNIYGYSAKRDIKVGEIITTKDIKIIPDVKRGQSLEATLYSEGVFVNFSVTAMQDGLIGDIIRVKKGTKKSFKARIISPSNVDIVD
jgi:flagella basal body P-ring formation protein FlgA